MTAKEKREVASRHYALWSEYCDRPIIRAAFFAHIAKTLRWGPKEFNAWAKDKEWAK